MYRKFIATTLPVLMLPAITFAQGADNIINTNNTIFGLWIIALIFIVPLLIIIGKLYYDFKQQIQENNDSKKVGTAVKFSQYLKNFDRKQVRQFLKLKNKKIGGEPKSEANSGNVKPGTMLFILFILTESAFAQTNTSPKSLTSQPGIIITIVLLLIPILLAVVFALIKSNKALKNYINTNKKKEATQFADYLRNLDNSTIDESMIQKDKTPEFNLTHNELSGPEKASDTKGIISNISDKHAAHFIALKRKAINRPVLDADITKLILWYLGCSTFWLLMGTGIRGVSGN